MMLKRILCIEDDPVTLMLTRHVLVKSGFAREVLSAKDGQEALAVLEHEAAGSKPEIDLILLDLNMPVMDGWQFLDKYMADFGLLYPNIKVIIVSSSVDEQDFDRAKNYEVVLRFISKPLTHHHLESMKEIEDVKGLFLRTG